MYSTFLHHPILEAIGAALVHSIWQGALVAVGLYVALRLLKSADSSVRYMLCSAALVLLVLLPVSTGIQIYVSNQSAPAFYTIPQAVPQEVDLATASSANAPAFEGSDPVAVPVTPDPSTTDPIQEAYASTFSWRPYVVWVWLIGVVVLSVRWVFGLFQVHRLKSKGQVVEDASIQAAFDALLVRLGITRKVRLLTTIHVDQPMVIGWLKPVVLLPFSLATNLSPEHVEAILAHELVHVRRHDYLVLVFQSVIEILFFYHPAIWWVSQQVRIERECSCDDLAAEVLGNELTYVTALASLDSGRASRLALGANDGRLVDRIRRIVQRKVEGTQQSTFSWLGVGVLLFGCGLLVTACMNWSEPDLDGTPEELFATAIEKIKDENLSAAKPYAERAAEQGDMCSMRLLAYMYYPKKGTIHYDNGTRGSFVQWGPQNEETSKQWAEAFKRELIKKADSGDKDAAFFLHVGYWSMARSNMPESYVFSDSDSLSQLWLDRAYSMDHPYAVRKKAVEAVQKRGDLEEGYRLFKKAIELGDDSVYEYWSYLAIEQEDPAQLFSIVDLALRNEARGTHKWVGDLLSKIDEQIALGNEETIPWKERADSLRIAERLNELPENPPTHKSPISGYLELCGKQDPTLFVKKPWHSIFTQHRETPSPKVQGVTW